MKKTLLLVLGALALAAVLAWHLAPGVWLQPLLAANRSLSGLSARSIPAAGHEVHYLEGGPATGVPLVLLHGIFAEKDHWVDFARPLTGAWRVIAPDLPGFGQSGRHAQERYDYAAQVERLRAWLDAVQQPRVHLAGSSMGGTLAVLFALKYPDRVASVALIGSPHGVRTAEQSAMDALIDAGQAPLVAHDSQAFDRMMALVFGRRPWIPHPVLHAAQAGAMRDAQANLALWQAQLRDRYLLDDRLPDLRAPTLALWGEADQVFHPSGLARLRERLPLVRAQALPGLGHLPMMEAPGETAAAYEGFLRSLPR